VWVVKSSKQLGWFSEQLSSVAADVERLQGKLRDIKLELTVYITCDAAFTEEHNSLLDAVTSPAHKTTVQKEVEHGTVQSRNRPSQEGDAKIDEKEKVREVTAVTDENQDGAQCCCRTEINENAGPDSIALSCCCAASQKKTTTTQRTSLPISITSSSPPSSLRSKLLVEPNKKPFIHPSITIYTGRPKTKEIVRRSLEQALGESAVVVCGPQGLVADVKRDVCSLSDERAVHKGTGAQGIYLHTECFSY
jgi:hypothetical protein